MEVNRSLDRREIIKRMAATGSVGLIAGCSSDGDGGDGDGSDGGDGGSTNTDSEGVNRENAVDPWLTHRAMGNLEQANFNQYDPNNDLFLTARWGFELMVQYLPEAREFAPWLATDWSRDGDTATLSIREGISWHDGTDVTAQDVVNHYRLQKTQGHPVWDYADSLNLADDYTVEISLAGDVNTQVLWNRILIDEPIFENPNYYQEYIDREQDATTDDAMETLAGDLQKFKIDPHDPENFDIGNGVMQYTKFSNQEILMEPYEDYPVKWDTGNEINFKGCEFKPFGGTDSGQSQAWIADDLDFVSGALSSEQTRSQYPDHYHMMTIDTTKQTGLVFGQKSPNGWGDDTEESRKMRQAVAYILDSSKTADIKGERYASAPDPNAVTSMAPVLDNEWLKGGILSDLTNYGNTETGWKKEEEAAQAMRDAGFTKEGGQWTKDGEPATITIYYPNEWSPLIGPTENVGEQLTDFGIQAEVQGKESTSLFGSILMNHEFDLVNTVVGSAPHPYGCFRNNMGTLSSPRGVYNNMRSELTVPWPPGDPDGEETVSVDERIKSLGKAEDPEKAQEIVNELAWITNQWVTLIEVDSIPRKMGISTDDWEFGDLESPEVQSEQFWAHLARTGQFKAKTK